MPFVLAHVMVCNEIVYKTSSCGISLKWKIFNQPGIMLYVIVALCEMS